jgi:hypothetical protein
MLVEGDYSHALFKGAFPIRELEMLGANFEHPSNSEIQSDALLREMMPIHCLVVVHYASETQGMGVDSMSCARRLLSGRGCLIRRIARASE